MKDVSRKKRELDLVVYTCNLSTQVAEAGGVQVWCQPSYIIRPGFPSPHTHTKKKKRSCIFMYF
jgi:hypothetical protein